MSLIYIYIFLKFSIVSASYIISQSLFYLLLEPETTSYFQILNMLHLRINDKEKENLA